MSHDLTATSADQETRIGHYQLLRTLGQGSYGKVRWGWHNLTNTEVAVKAIRSRQGHSSLQRQLPEEADCMAVLHHPHIVQLFEVIVTKEVVYLIMEHVSGGDLKDYLQIHIMLSENEARGIFRQLVSAVHYMHQKGVVHRDLKPSNVLLEAGMRVKVADFGLSAFFNNRKFSAFCGNHFYAAPEVFLAEEYDGPPVDIWSLGVLLYRMVTGHVPFQDNDLRELKKAVLSGKYPLPLYLSSRLRYLLSKLITLNPKDRSSLEDFMPNQWLNMGDEEELKPYSETPPSEDLDPWVTQEMVDMGFRRDQIKNALQNKTYDYIMGTYLLLNTKKPRVQYRTIRVKPFSPPDLNTSQVPTQDVQPECSRPQQTEQQHKNRESEQKPMLPAGTAARLTSRTDTPEPRPQSKTPIPGPSMESRTPTLRPSVKSRIPIAGPSVKSRTATPRASLKSGTSTHRPKVESRTATPGPSVEYRTNTPRPRLMSRTPTPRPSRKSRTPTPRPSRKSNKVSPQPSPKWRKVSPRHSPKSRTAILRPTPKCRTPSPRLRPKRKTTTPPPIQESEFRSSVTPHSPESPSRTATPPPIPDSESGSTIPPHSPESQLGTATPQLIPESESRTTTPRPIPELESCSATPPLALESESRTATSTPSPESNATPSPAPQCGPGVAPSSHSSSSGGNQEQTSQGQRGMARRCWDFFKKLCLRPCKKGHGRRNKVMPL